MISWTGFTNLIYQSWQGRFRPCFLLTMKKNLRSNKNYIFWLVCGFLYYLLARYTVFSLPCPFRYFTGYLCPGCGITTLLLAVSEGDFTAARAANPFLFYTLPLFVASILLRRFYLSKASVQFLDKRIYPVYAIALICFGVYRNLI